MDPRHAQTMRVEMGWRMAGMGFTTMLAQVLLLREANVWLRGNEFIIACVVACWLAWFAVGTAAGCRMASPATASRWMLAAWVASVLVSVGELAVLRCCWPWTGGLQGQAVGLAKASLLACAVTCLPCLYAGCALGGAIRWCGQDRGMTVAWLYLRETLGAVAAGMLATFVLIPLERWWMAVALLLAMPLMTRRRVAHMIVAGALVAAGGFFNAPLEHLARNCATRMAPGTIALDLDTPRARLTVMSRGGGHAFFRDGRFCGADVQREDAEELAWYAVLARPAVSNALVVGFAYNGLVRELVQKGIATTVLDEQRAYLERLTPFLLPEDQRALAAPLAHIVAADTRVFLHETTASFDLIVQDAGVPDSYAAARLYSTEWYALAARRLTPAGVLVVALPSSPGYVPGDLARLLARTQATLSSVFSHVTLLPASRTVLVATHGPAIPSDAPFWCAQWQALGTNSLRFNAVSIADNLDTYRRDQYARACGAFAHMAAHRDVQPLMYGDALRYAEARYAGGMHAMLAALYDAPGRLKAACTVCVLLWGTLVLAGRRRPRMRLWLAMAAVAAAGFVAEMTVVARFVTARGSVCYALGMLFACCMLGLAGAASAVRKVPAARAWRWTPLVLAVVLAMAACMPWPERAWAIMTIAGGANLLAGFCVGACFAWLARSAADTDGGMAVYVADLGGALVGGILFSIVLPPVLGFGALALMMGAVLVLVCVL